MIEFKKPELSDASEIRKIIDKTTSFNCDLNFANMFVWRDTYGVRICVHDDTLMKGYFDDDKNEVRFSMPIGYDDLKASIQAMLDYAEKIGYHAYFSDIDESNAEKYKSIFHETHTLIPDRDYSDYVYLQSDLATLSGRKYQKKRNHISKFDREYDGVYKPITPENTADARAVYSKWCEENSDKIDSDETNAINTALDNFNLLSMSGGILYANGTACAVTMGSRINNNVFDVQFEKALLEFDGAYTKINQCFAETLSGYKYINREEDLGIEGLRKAKLSYHPALINLRYSARII